MQSLCASRNIPFYRPFVVAVVVFFSFMAAACALTDSRDDVQSITIPGQTAPRLQNLGDHTFPVTTDSARAQLFISQGMMLAYGFNHAEAARSFKEAARLDPDCAMAYWGMALVMGPNINMAMSPEAEPQAYAMVQEAIQRRANASPREQAYIDALATRYINQVDPDRIGDPHPESHVQFGADPVRATQEDGVSVLAAQDPARVIELEEAREPAVAVLQHAG